MSAELIYAHPRLLFLDFEGTGTDPQNDRIVEAAFHRAVNETWVTRVNPECPIPAEATAVHGIRDEDVRDAPTFRELASRIQAMVTGAVLVGYNLRRYDTLLLDAELRRAGQPGLARDEDGRLQVPEIDLFQLWQRHEPRTLTGAAKRFAGVELGDDAHTAEADTVVLLPVLEGMITAFGIAPEVDALCRLSVPDGEVDRDGKFRRRDDGVVVFNFGQKRGTPVMEEEGLLRWMLARDFSAESKAYARAFLAEIEEAWRREEEEEVELPF